MTNEEMDRLTEGLTAKAAKVRALHAAGVSTGDIGRYLGIRYQHVYNVLLRAGLIEKAAPPVSERLPLSGDEIIVAQVGKAGGIELPAEVMERYGLAPGGTVYCQALPEGLMILSQEAALRQVTALAREKMPEQAALIEALLRTQRDG
ncbi:AbrB/MazE/SpoVT family DNA-binding domain-containing protein [Sphingobium sp. Leaf26]|uniref:AbrB/MazE/SpoVT family DNA-binding domain-containing protein n=1 Tax=Sphingobium sp. Leaf26 TaxID=1735693 RepID=UPI0012E2019A|nr:AbrB/MazE/SpoVT family DNA-binding domain-containing protein [Sphingobium sp. Leaf26]